MLLGAFASESPVLILIQSVWEGLRNMNFNKLPVQFLMQSESVKSKVWMTLVFGILVIQEQLLKGETM